MHCTFIICVEFNFMYEVNGTKRERMITIVITTTTTTNELNRTDVKHKIDTKGYEEHTLCFSKKEKESIVQYSNSNSLSESNTTSKSDDEPMIFVFICLFGENEIEESI